MKLVNDGTDLTANVTVQKNVSVKDTDVVFVYRFRIKGTRSPYK